METVSVSISMQMLAAAVVAIYFALFSMCLILTRFKDNGKRDEISKSAESSVKTTEEKSNSDSLGLARKPSYRFDEENFKNRSSEYSSRGRVWLSRPNWHLTSAPRANDDPRLLHHSNLDHVLSILRKYDVDPYRGFLPSQDPLQRLPYARYHIWEDLADDLPKLLSARLGQARDPLKQLPVLSIDKLSTDRELRRAHLLLCLFAHAFVWGGNEPLDYIPEGIAKPLIQVSNKLGIPPVLGHPSIVLYNWRRFDIQGDICMENLSTLNNFFDGRDENWFYLITVEIEAKGAAAVMPMMLAIDAIMRYNEEPRFQSNEPYVISKSSEDIGLPIATGEDDALSERYASQISSNEELSGELSDYRMAIYVTQQLKKISNAIKEMCQSLTAMREGCHPFIFYHRVRPFLSGWKHNPTLPNGIVYKGVSDARFQYYGGSAAQSSLIPLLDIGLGISHDSIRSKDFLLAMRDYMVKSHRDFLTYLESVACIREFVLSVLNNHGILSTDRVNRVYTELDSISAELKIYTDLRDAYDSCVEGVRNFRTGHISLVADYIMLQQKKASSGKKSIEESAGGKGTGGTDLMTFLKPIRDNCGDSMLNRPVSNIEERLPSEPKEGENIIYIKDHGDFEDIDLYRGGYTFTNSSPNEIVWK